MASSLISSCSSLHDRDSNGQTALHHAVENGHRDTAALLLDVGAEINSRDLDGSSLQQICKESSPTAHLTCRFKKKEENIVGEPKVSGCLVGALGEFG